MLKVKTVSETMDPGELYDRLYFEETVIGACLFVCVFGALVLAAALSVQSIIEAAQVPTFLGVGVGVGVWVALALTLPFTLTLTPSRTLTLARSRPLPLALARSPRSASYRPATGPTWRSPRGTSGTSSSRTYGARGRTSARPSSGSSPCY